MHLLLFIRWMGPSLQAQQHLMWGTLVKREIHFHRMPNITQSLNTIQMEAND